MIEDVLAKIVEEAVLKAYPGVTAAPEVRRPDRAGLGDYQSTVSFRVATQVKVKPVEAAQRIAEALELGEVATVSVTGPFLNFRLTSTLLAAELGKSPVREEGPVVVVDYSGPNVAKEMHVGHLRSSVIGDSLARVLTYTGHRVVRQNHLGDWGTQFGMLVEMVLSQGLTLPSSNAGLTSLYQSARALYESDETFAAASRQRVVLLQAGDPATLAVWEKLVSVSTQSFQETYERMGLLLTEADLRPESSYNQDLPGIVSDLAGKGLLTVSNGAQCVFPPGFVDPNGNPLPLIVVKSGGGYLYATTDLAALRYRTGNLGADRVVYVTDARQAQHFAMVFSVAEQMGWSADLVHVPFGTVLGPDGKPFKTRAGQVVSLQSLLDDAEEAALVAVKERREDLSEDLQVEIARKVALAAVKFSDLSSDRVKDYVFDPVRMTSFKGATGPSLQYAVVRVNAVLAKATSSRASVTLATDPERFLAAQLVRLESVVQEVVRDLKPHVLCTFLLEVVDAFTKLYESTRIVGSDREGELLSLLVETRNVLETGMNLLGIPVLDRM